LRHSWFFLKTFQYDVYAPDSKKNKADVNKSPDYFFSQIAKLSNNPYLL